MSQNPWKLTEFEALEAPAVTVLFYHNRYEEGKQGGLEILQEATRIAANGNLRLEAAAEQWSSLPEHGPRQIQPDGSMSVECNYANPPIHYTARLSPLGNELRLTVDLAEPLPEEWVGRVSFNLELQIGAFMEKSFLMDGHAGSFPRSYISPKVKNAAGAFEPAPLAVGKKLVTAPGNPALQIKFEALNGELILLDGRGAAENGWYVLRGMIPAGVTTNALQWSITPSIQPGWVRPPAILFSQVGYHSAQKKVAVIELDGQVQQPGEARLVRLSDNGFEVVKTQKLALWGPYLCYNYAQFDFSEVSQPGLYQIEYEGSRGEAFPISPDVFKEGVWQPTLEDYFPVQMCHMEVRHGYRIWHGLCHMDDALQAPTNHEHFDGYRQYATTDTDFAPYEHIPHLDRGGWHDAGDYDLAAGSQAQTTRVLVLAREDFGLDSDQTTVKPAELKVEMHVPDGIPDVIQQVAHGVENMLSGYRASGHTFIGIIENNLRQYVHLGDPATMTDNVVTPGPESQDRWAFTQRHTTLEYAVMGALASAARVLKGWNDALATEALETAQRSWEYEQTHEPQFERNCYIGGDPNHAKVRAAVELLLTTGDDKYRQSLLASADMIAEHIFMLGASVARVLPQINDAAFTARIREAAANYSKFVVEDARKNPFGVPYTDEMWRKHAPVWGVGWSLQGRAVDFYYLHRAFPDLFSRDLVTDTLDYVLGCHPASNHSLVSGVGARSMTIAYGINRADWTFIPGGVVSGPALILPNYPELMDPFPFLWQQKEYVMSGAATYIFLVLAADQLCSAPEQK